MQKAIVILACVLITTLYSGCATTEKTPVSSTFVEGVMETGSKSATLTWEAPTTNADGSPLADLAGYKVYYRHKSGDPYCMEAELKLGDPGLDCHEISSDDAETKTECTYTVKNLCDQTHHFVVTAFNKFGTESKHSNVAYK